MYDRQGVVVLEPTYTTLRVTLSHRDPFLSLSVPLQTSPHFLSHFHSFVTLPPPVRPASLSSLRVPPAETNARPFRGFESSLSRPRETLRENCETIRNIPRRTSLSDRSSSKSSAKETATISRQFQTGDVYNRCNRRFEVTRDSTEGWVLSNRTWLSSTVKTLTSDQYEGRLRPVDRFVFRFLVDDPAQCR